MRLWGHQRVYHERQLSNPDQSLGCRRDGGFGWNEIACEELTQCREENIGRIAQRTRGGVDYKRCNRRKTVQ